MIRCLPGLRSNYYFSLFFLKSHTGPSTVLVMLLFHSESGKGCFPSWLLSYFGAGWLLLLMFFEVEINVLYFRNLVKFVLFLHQLILIWIQLLHSLREQWHDPTENFIFLYIWLFSQIISIVFKSFHRTEWKRRWGEKEEKVWRERIRLNEEQDFA